MVTNILNERKVELGGKEYEIKPNLEMSFNLQKYRNKNGLGIEVTKENRKSLEKIFKLVQKSQEGEIGDLELFEKLNDTEKALLMEMSNKNSREYSLGECIDITKNVLAVSEIEARDILDEEFAISDFDTLQLKVQTMLNLVFMSAKDTSKQKVVSLEAKTEVQVAE